MQKPAEHRGVNSRTRNFIIISLLLPLMHAVIMPHLAARPTGKVLGATRYRDDNQYRCYPHLGVPQSPNIQAI